MARLQTELKETALQMQVITQKSDEISNNAAICALDEKSAILSLSDGFYKLTGYSHQEIHDRFNDSFYLLLCEEDRERVRAQTDYLAGQDPRHNPGLLLEYQLCTKSGQLLWISEETHLLRKGKKTCCRRALWDITQKKAIGENLKSLTSNIPGGVCLVKLDENFTLLYGNEEFYTLYGYTPEQMRSELHNNLISRIHPDDIPGIIQITSEAYEHKRSSFGFEKRVFRRDGTTICLLTKGNFIVDDENGVAMNCVIIDITDRKQMELELRIDEERFRLALEQTASLVFDYELLTGSIRQSKQAAQLYGLPEVLYGIPAYLVESGIIHPDYVGVLYEAFHRIQQGEPAAACELRTRHVDGHYLWNRMLMTTIYGENKKPMRAVGVLEDITLQREAELAYAREEQYRQAMLSEAVAYMEVDCTSDRIAKISGLWADYICDATACSYTEYLALVCENIIHPEDRQRYASSLSASAMLVAFQSGCSEIKVEHRRLGSDAKMSWMLLTVHLVRDPVTGNVRSLTYLKDIDQQKRGELELKYQSMRDSLTGLYNKGTTETLVQTFLSGREEEALCAFFVLDVDYFKMINDTYGHLFGDHVLSEVAAHIQDSFRASDIIGRVGGDEFAILMKDLSTREVAEKKAIEICKIFSTTLGESAHFSCSVGISLCPQDGVSFEQLYKSADAALYDAKKVGRNCYVFYQPEMEMQALASHNAATESETPSPAALPCAPMEIATPDERLEAALLEEISDVIYVSDPQTYELLYVNHLGGEQLGLAGNAYQGQPCYKILQGRNRPCPFCTNHLLQLNHYYVWEHVNELLGRRYMIKDKLIHWNGKLARMEFAMDITDWKNVEPTFSACPEPPQP